MSVSTIGYNNATMSQVLNAGMSRTLSIGNTWNRLRIGIVWRIQDIGGTYTNAPTCAFGLCSGTSNIYLGSGSITAANFLGIISATSSLGTPIFNPYFSRLNNYLFSNPLSSDTGGFSFCGWQVSASVYTSAGAIPPNYSQGTIADVSASNGYSPSLFIIEYIRTGPSNITMNAGYSYTGYAGGSLSDLTVWCTQVVPDPTPEVAYGYAQRLTSLTASIDAKESLRGNLDTVMFFWGSNQGSIYIQDVVVGQIS